MLWVLLLTIITLTTSQDISVNLRLLDENSATVSLELTNRADYWIALLRWNLPLDSRFQSDSFHVLYNGKPVQYIGSKVKYASPELSDYVFFGPNETVRYEVALGNSYDFSQPGLYDVIFVTDALDYETQDDFDTLPHKNEGFSPFSGMISNSVHITTTSSISQEIVRTPYPCTASETTQINSAASSKKTMIAKAVTEITKGQTGTYGTWFGAFTEARHATVLSTIERISKNTIVAYRCDNERGVYAYVYPTDTTHTIYCCEAFWGSPVAGGFDTKAGTLIHELSHFNTIGRTQDYAYGTTAAEQLAISNPARAIANADNYEYFSESLW